MDLLSKLLKIQHTQLSLWNDIICKIQKVNDESNFSKTYIFFGFVAYKNAVFVITGLHKMSLLYMFISFFVLIFQFLISNNSLIIMLE